MHQDGERQADYGFMGQELEDPRSFCAETERGIVRAQFRDHSYRSAPKQEAMRGCDNERVNLHLGRGRRTVDRDHRLINSGRKELLQQDLCRQRQELQVHQVPRVLHVRKLLVRRRQVEVLVHLRHQTQDVAPESVPH
jgi:hypothetical protein